MGLYDEELGRTNTAQATKSVGRLYDEELGRINKTPENDKPKIIPTTIGNDGVIQTSVVPKSDNQINPSGQTAISRLNPLQKINYNIQKGLGHDNVTNDVAKMHNNAIMREAAERMLSPTNYLEGSVNQNVNINHPILNAVGGFIKDHWHPLESAKNMTRGAVQGFVGGIGSAINNGLHGLKNSALDVVNAGVPLYKNAPQTDIDYVQSEFHNKHPFKSLIPLYNGYVTRSTLANNIREAQKNGLELNPDYIGAKARALQPETTAHATSGMIQKIPHTQWWFDEPKVSFAHKLGRFGGELAGFNKMLELAKLGNTALVGNRIANQAAKVAQKERIIGQYANKLSNRYSNLINSSNEAIANRAKQVIAEKTSQFADSLPKLAGETHPYLNNFTNTTLANAEIGAQFAGGERIIDNLNGEGENYIDQTTGEEIPFINTLGTGALGGAIVGNAMHYGAKGIGKIGNGVLSKIPAYNQWQQNRKTDAALWKIISNINNKGRIDRNDISNLSIISEMEGISEQEAQSMLNAIANGVITNPKAFNQTLANIKRARKFKSKPNNDPPKPPTQPEPPQEPVSHVEKQTEQITPKQTETSQNEHVNDVKTSEYDTQNENNVINADFNKNNNTQNDVTDNVVKVDFTKKKQPTKEQAELNKIKNGDVDTTLPKQEIGKKDVKNKKSKNKKPVYNVEEVNYNTEYRKDNDVSNEYGYKKEILEGGKAEGSDYPLSKNDSTDNKGTKYKKAIIIKKDLSSITKKEYDNSKDNRNVKSTTQEQKSSYIGDYRYNEETYIDKNGNKQIRKIPVKYKDEPYTDENMIGQRKRVPTKFIKRIYENGVVEILSEQTGYKTNGEKYKTYSVEKVNFDNSNLNPKTIKTRKQEYTKNELGYEEVSAFDENGELKKGFVIETDKNGKEIQLSDGTYIVRKATYKERQINKGKAEAEKLLNGNSSTLNRPSQKVGIDRVYQDKTTSHTKEANKYFRENGINDVEVNEYGHLVYKGGEKDGLPLSKRDEHRLKEKLGYVNTRPFGEGAEAEDMTLKKINGQLFAVKKGNTPKEDVYYRAYSDSNGVYSIDKEPYDRFATGKEDYIIDEWNDDVTITDNNTNESVEIAGNKKEVNQNKVEDTRNYSTERSAKVVQDVLRGKDIRTALKGYDAKSKQDLVDLANALTQEQARYVDKIGKNVYDSNKAEMQNDNLDTNKTVKLSNGQEITVNDREVAIDEILTHLANHGITTNTKIRSLSAKETRVVNEMFSKSRKGGNIFINKGLNGSYNEVHEQLMKSRDFEQYQDFYNKVIKRIDGYKFISKNTRLAAYKRIEQMADSFEQKTGATIQRAKKRYIESDEAKLTKQVNKMLDADDFNNAIKLFHEKNIDYDNIYNSELRKAYKKAYEMMYEDTHSKINDLELTDYSLAYKYNIVKSEKAENGRISLKERPLSQAEQRKVDLLRIKLYNQITKSRAKSIANQNTLFAEDEASHWVTDGNGNLKTYTKEAFDKNVNLDETNKMGERLTQQMMDRARKALPKNLQVIADYVNYDGSFNRGRIQTAIKHNYKGSGYLKQFFANERTAWKNETKAFARSIMRDSVSENDWEIIEGKSTSLEELADLLKHDERSNTFTNPKTNEVVTDREYNDVTLNKIRSLVKAHNRDMMIYFIKPAKEYENTNGFFNNNTKSISICINGNRPYKETLLEEIAHSCSQYEIDTTPELRHLDGVAADAGQDYINFLNETTNGETNAEIVNRFEKKLEKIYNAKDNDSKNLVISFLKGDKNADYKSLKDKYDISFNDLRIYKNRTILKSKYKSTLEEQYADALIKGEINDTTSFISFCKDRRRKIGNNGTNVEGNETRRQNIGYIGDNNGRTQSSRRDSRGNRLNSKTYSIKDFSHKVKTKYAEAKLGKDPIVFIDSLNTQERNELYKILGSETAAKGYDKMAYAVGEREHALVELGLTDEGRLNNASRNALASVMYENKPVKDLTTEEKQNLDDVHKALILSHGAKQNLYFRMFSNPKDTIDINGNDSSAIFGVKKNSVKLPEATPENIKKIIYNAISQAEHAKEVVKFTKFLQNNYAKPIEKDRNGIPRVEDGYTAINSKVLNLSIFKGMSKYFYEAVTKGEKNIIDVFGDNEFGKEILDIYRNSIDYDFQIPTKIYNHLFSGHGETPYEIQERYGRKAWKTLAGRVLDSLMIPFNAKVLGLSPSWMVNNALSNAIMADKEYDSIPDQFIHYAKAMKVSDKDVPSDIIGNNITSVLDLASSYNTSLYLTGNKKTDTVISSILGMCKVNTANLKGADKYISETANVISVPARILRKISKKLFEVNKNVENLQRKALYLKQAEKQYNQDIDFGKIKHVAQNMTRQQEALKYVNENSALRKITTDSVLNTLGDYESLSNFERNVIKRVVPYYQWYKAVVNWTTNYIKNKPGEFGQLLLELNRLKDKNGNLPEDQRLSIPLYKNKKGEQILFNLERIIPTSTYGEMGLNIIHPVLKAIIETPFDRKISFHNIEKKSKRYKRIGQNGNYDYIDTKTGKTLDHLPIGEKAKYAGMQMLNQLYLPHNNKFIDIEGDISALYNYTSIDPNNKKAGQLTPKQGQYDTSLGRFNNDEIIKGADRKKKLNGDIHRRRNVTEYSAEERVAKKVLPIQKARPVYKPTTKEEKEKFKRVQERMKKAKQSNNKINRYFY